jgi:hypothetical protein
LLCDEKPFSRETVSCWLSSAQHFLDGSAELGMQDIQQLSTVEGLTQVLAFADAVGSPSGLSKALCSQLQQLKFVVQLPEQVLELPMARFIYGFDPGSNTQLVQYNLQQRARVGAPLVSAEQVHDVQQQVAKQLSALLQLAHALRLQPLLNTLHDFLLHNIKPGGPFLLSGVVGLVFSDAVLEAALGSSTLSKEAYISSVLSQPCSLTPGAVGHASLLKPTGSPQYDPITSSLVFDAQLLQDFAGGKVGDSVKVTLSLFGASAAPRGFIRVKLSSVCPSLVTLPAQLLLGYDFADAEALDDFMKVNPHA